MHVEKIKWIRNGSFAFFGFSFFNLFTLYMDKWDSKYLYAVLVCLIIALILLLIFVISENTFKNVENKNQYNAEKEDLQEIIKKLKNEVFDLNSSLILKEENVNGLKEMVDTYNFENKSIMNENQQLKQSLWQSTEFIKLLIQNMSTEEITEFEAKSSLIEKQSQLIIGGYTHGKRKENEDS